MYIVMHLHLLHMLQKIQSMLSFHVMFFEKHLQHHHLG
jgi:hypothetical protein